MSIQKSFDEIAKSLGLNEMTTFQVIDLLKFDILTSAYRKNPKNKFERDLNEKIEKVYSDWSNGSEFVYDPSHKNLSMFLMGPPGQGKTTTFKVAAKQVADALGLTLVVNPGDDYKPSRKDFLFVSLECSGENSTITFGGLPIKVEEFVVDENGKNTDEKITYMTKVPNKRMAILSNVAGGVFLLDDFSNAAPNVQNAALSITDEKRFQGVNLDHTYIGLTGNLGAIDGTHTTKTSTALRGRCITIFTRDTPEQFAARTHEKYPDDISDANVLPFLHRNIDCFAWMPDNKSSGGYPSPRTWDHFMSEARSLIMRGGGKGVGEKRMLEQIKTFASTILGNEVGQKFAAYYYSLIQGADPLARLAIIEDKMKKEDFEEKYGKEGGAGKSQQQQDFGYQFAVACADYTVQMIKKEKDNKLDVAMKRFGKAVLKLNPSEFAYAIDYLTSKLAVSVDKYCAPSSKDKQFKQLSTEAKTEMCKIIAALDDFDSGKQETLVNAISNFDKLDSTTTRRRRVTR